MTYKEFSALVSRASDCTDLAGFMSEEGGVTGAPETAVSVWIYVRSGLAELLKHLELSKNELSRDYGIPYRSIQNWTAGDRVPPKYVLDLIAFAVITNQD